MFIYEKDGKFGGLFGNVIMELRRVMNFTISKTIYEPSFGHLNEQAKQWSGVVGVLADGKADIGVSDFTISNRRLDVVDFSLPLVLSKCRLFIKKPGGSTVQWSGYFKVHDNFYKKICCLSLFLLFINNL